MSRPMFVALFAILSVSITHAAPQPVADHWSAVDAVRPVDVRAAQRLRAALHIGLADGSGTGSCPAGAWTGQATFTGGADGTLVYWGTGFGCAPHGVGTLQYPDGSSYFGRVTSFIAGPGLPLHAATFRPAVPDGPGQMYSPNTGAQLLGRFLRGSFSADLRTDTDFVAAYQAAYASIADRGAPLWTPAVERLFAAATAPMVPASGGASRSPFPPHLPRRPAFDLIEEWLDRVTAPGWEAEARAVLDAKDGSVRGWRLLKTMFGDLLSDCDKVGKQGTVVVEDGGQLHDGFMRYRGGWGGCGPAGNGLIEYADGRRYIGQVKSGMSPGTTLNYRVAGLGLWQLPDGRSTLVHDGRGRLNFGAPGEWWAEGDFDTQWNSLDASFHAADGSEFRGVLKHGRPGGNGVWRDLRSGLQVTGLAATDEHGLVLTGVLEFELTGPRHLGGGSVLPAGRYHHASTGGWRPGTLPPADQLIPTAETLAQPVTRGACRAEAVTPSGWKVWWPSCHRDGTGLESVASYAPDRSLRLMRAPAGAVLEELDPESPTEVWRRWEARGFTTSNPPTPHGVARLSVGGVVQYEGSFAGLVPDGEGLCALPAGEGAGMEPCEFRAGDRVDPLHHLRRQRLALQAAQQEQLRQQEVARRAEQQRIAALQAQQRQQAAAAKQQGGFQWGKFAAMAVAGGAASAAGRFDSSTNMKVLEGIVKDSVAGAQGMSNLQAVGASAGTSPSLGAAGGGQGVVAAGSYPARPNTLDGHPACSGYSVNNYKEFYAQNSAGPDAQLHSMCAAAYNYYWMYLNAIRQGYSQADSDRTYAAFSGAAQVATSHYQSAR